MRRLTAAAVARQAGGRLLRDGPPCRGAEIDTRGDAAMVQAFAVAGLLADGEMVIDGAQGVDDVFPGFFDSLESVKQERKR